MTVRPIWQEGVRRPDFPALRGNVKTDVLIIGGGMAGVLCAYFLHQAGVSYCLVEQNRIGSGTTSGTTAKLTAQHGALYQRLIREKSVEAAQVYYRIAREALAVYRSLCAEIDCDYEIKDSYVYSRDDKALLDRELAAMEKIGCPAVFRADPSLPFPVAGAVCMPHQAQFHPLKFLYAIAEGLHIYEQTAVKEMVGNTAVTDRGRIDAEQVIVTTHFPFLNKHGSYFIKLYQHRSYLLALSGAPLPDGMYVDADSKGMTFRSYGDLLLMGGGGHRTGKKGGGWQELRRFASTHYPKAEIVAMWAAQDCISLDGMPYIGRYSSKTKQLYVASGFNKWGMSGSMSAAMLLRDMILGKRNDAMTLFSPSRSICRPSLLVNGWEATAGLLTLSKKRCPHLGCALKWNAAEHSWDCPCHGSRFDRAGHVLDNPANGDLPR